ncbi:MAG: hypothetical protein Edafosvirus1_30 [Edafosvirus sp.]|uniref:Uncharacterized protein n=1 Tax=Edafosvirus sp. TaxID=2487765 RepID=A0A3G4ZW86_9VIRU|nr:MAG: hypothetical protein Edafosvirus1_30 [Edafosvirus sp.]
MCVRECLSSETILQVSKIPKSIAIFSLIGFVMLMNLLNIYYRYTVIYSLFWLIVLQCKYLVNQSDYIFSSEEAKLKEPKYWTEDLIFNTISKMKIYDQNTLHIFEDKFYKGVHNGAVRPISENISHIPSVWWWVSMWGYTLPTRKALDAMMNVAELDLKNKKILSVGCGGGLWERLLNQRGCDIIRTDTNLHGQPYIFVSDKTIQVIESQSVYNNLIELKAIKSPKEIDVLFMAWPEPDDIHLTNKKEISEHGYDERALINFEGEHVILICDLNNDKVVSKNAKKILAEQYTIIKQIDLPYYKDQYNPIVLIYKKNI